MTCTLFSSLQADLTLSFQRRVTGFRPWCHSLEFDSASPAPLCYRFAPHSPQITPKRSCKSRSQPSRCMQELHVTRCSLIFWLILFFDITNALKRQGICFGLCPHCLCPQIQNSHAAYGLLQNKLWYQIPTKNHWIRRCNLDRYRLHLTAVQTNCDQQPSSANNCLDNTELLPKQQEHSCPDQWSYMLAEQLCPLSNLEPSLCHNEIWSSSCNAKCCFACEMPVLISLFQESEFLNHEEENTTYNWVFLPASKWGLPELVPIRLARFLDWL